MPEVFPKRKFDGSSVARVDTSPARRENFKGPGSALTFSTEHGFLTEQNLSHHSS